MDIVLSGIRPTGQLHLGNYFGALRNFVRMQHDAKCYFFIADYHALTTHDDPTRLHENVRTVLAEYLAAGIDPDVATVYVQSDVPQVTELSLLLGMHAYVVELERTASFKDKVRKNPSNVNAGLLTYPVLMAADILLHRATHVPVGKDQEQHLELPRVFARRFNNMYGVEYFPESQPYNFGAELVKMPGLDGTGKMGKSENTGIFLADSAEAIRKKEMRAVTAGAGISPERGCRQHLHHHAGGVRARYRGLFQGAVRPVRDTLRRPEEAARRGHYQGHSPHTGADRGHQGR